VALTNNYVTYIKVFNVKNKITVEIKEKQRPKRMAISNLYPVRLFCDDENRIIDKNIITRKLSFR